MWVVRRRRNGVCERMFCAGSIRVRHMLCPNPQVAAKLAGRRGRRETAADGAKTATDLIASAAEAEPRNTPFALLFTLFP
jgi:hypothetical protein